MTLQIWFQQHNRALTILSGGLIAFAIAFYLLNLQGGLLLFALAGLIAGAPILLRALAALRARVISIELLVTIAVIGAYVIGEYHEAAIVTFLFLFGDLLEKKTLEKTRAAVKSLTEMAPTTAKVIDDDGNVEVVDVDDVEVGDRVQVVAGDAIPVDGMVVFGTGSVNQAAITGESVAVKIEQEDAVLSGSIVEDGTLVIRSTRVSDDTTFAKIIELVEEAQDQKSPVERFIDRFARYYTPAVLLIALVTYAITADLRLAITLLVLGCPGALVIGAPVATVAGVGNGAKRGILFKGGDALAALASSTHFFFDKTGTLTIGKPAVASVFGELSADDWRTLVAIERESTHPLAQAVADYASKQDDGTYAAVSPLVKTIKGRGLRARVSNDLWLVGNEALMKDNEVTLSSSARLAIADFQNLGLSLVLVAKNNTLLAALGLRDVLRPEAITALNDLQNGSKKTRLTMLTGDHEKAAETIAKELALDDYHAGLMPEDKLAIVSKAQRGGESVAFVGDGINDAPALATADVGIAVGGGTDVAIETAPVVLMQASLNQLVLAKRLAEKTVKTTRENIFVAVFVVLLLLVGLLFGLVDMASGMLIHEVSILVVILNAMRLIRFDSSRT